MQYKILTDERLSQYIKFPNLTKDEELECLKLGLKKQMNQNMKNG